MGLLNLFHKNDINSGVEEYKAEKMGILLDVREPSEYADGHIKGSVNLPLQRIIGIEKIADDKSLPLYVHCLSGGRSGQAVAALKKMGYENVKNIGGISSYRGKLVKGK